MRRRLRELWRSMPVRLALRLVVLFAVVSLLSLAASYAVTQSSFEQASRADLEQAIAGFRAAPNAGAVARLVEAESREADPGRLILSYISPDGHIFGNGAIARGDEGYRIVSLDKDRAGYPGAYLALTVPLYGGQLTVARSRATIEALRGVFLNILLLSLLPTVLIALSGGLIIARRSQRRVGVIGGALDALTGGDLGARVEVGTRWPDDMARIGDKINQMARAQQASVAALRQVSSDIAHDLKTPIQRVAVHLEDAANAASDDAPVQHHIGQARDEVASISSVFRSLLQLANVESGSPRSRFGPVDLSETCATLHDIYEPSAAQNDQSLILTMPEQHLSVTGDRDLLAQMLSNLIENAMTHAGNGAAIAISLERVAERVTLRVSDDGPGIPLAQHEKVLQRLYRLDRSRATPGNGLGLSLVQSVARLHRAYLTLSDNEPGLQVAVVFPR